MTTTREARQADLDRLAERLRYIAQGLERGCTSDVPTILGDVSDHVLRIEQAFRRAVVA